MTPSGTIPRELAPGVVWDDAAEEAYQERAAIMQHDGRMPQEQAEQEARWAVELSLHHQFQTKQVARARACRTPQEKLALVAEWTEKYGKDRADRLISAVKGGQK